MIPADKEPGPFTWSNWAAGLFESQNMAEARVIREDTARQARDTLCDASVSIPGHQP